MNSTPQKLIKLIAGIFIFAGLILLGWGLDDLAGFFSHPARFTYIVLIVILQSIIVLRYPEIGSNRGKGRTTVARQHIVLLLMQVFSLAVVLAAPFSDRRILGVICEADLLRYLGLIIFTSGFVLMNWAEITLGKLFSVEVTIQDGHRLITGGPYRFLRHPRYLGIIVFNTGLSFIFRSWFSLIFVAVLAIVLLWRIHDEEILLHHEFGNEWESYKHKSWRLIPFVY